MIGIWVGGLISDLMGNSVGVIPGIALGATDPLQQAQVALQYGGIHTRMSESVDLY